MASLIELRENRPVRSDYPPSALSERHDNERHAIGQADREPTLKCRGVHGEEGPAVTDDIVFSNRQKREPGDYRKPFAVYRY